MERSYFHRKFTFRLKNKVDKSLKYIENKCSNYALQIILIGKEAHRKGNIRHVRNWWQAISNNFTCLFRSKIAKSQEISVLIVIRGVPTSRGKPTELYDGNYHRNKTIIFWSNGMTSPHRKYMVFPLKDHFFQ